MDYPARHDDVQNFKSTGHKKPENHNLSISPSLSLKHDGNSSIVSSATTSTTVSSATSLSLSLSNTLSYLWFIGVKGYSYKKRYMEEVKLQSSEQIKDVAKEPSKIEIIPKSEAQQSNQQSKISTSSAREQELDVFLLGGESDEDPRTTILIALTC
ncbi:hypothetical protein LWI29_019263 [Acer saccharum]|uniref:Uncharacterized protein n=1 Tax=Acer saccharum TaxID=4024 RepID=A0AA39SEA4_ACESA|nr:hypothetical protein LWI29_019263 [Acer saccharum]